LFGLSWPCSAEVEFVELWSELVREMSARGVVLGRAAFGGWDDAGPALAFASYCLTRQLRPEHAVETGVARGVTTRFSLEALDRNGSGGAALVDAVDFNPALREFLEQVADARAIVAQHDDRRRLFAVLRKDD